MKPFTYEIYFILLPLIIDTNITKCLYRACSCVIVGLTFVERVMLLSSKSVTLFILLNYIV